MNLRQRYKPSFLKNFCRFILFLSFTLFLMLFTSTYSRYETGKQEVTKADVAKWNIKVNNQLISTNGTANCPITLVTDRADGKLEPGTTGTFDIEIDPNETEVSVEYGINFDNLPNGIDVVSYEIIGSENGLQLFSGNIVGEIPLSSAREILTSGEKVIIRVHWVMENAPIDVSSLQEEDKVYSIQVGLMAKQKIDEINRVFEKIDIGDYVNYIPSPLQNTYILHKEDTNHTEDISVETEYDLGWRILDINRENGTVNLISEKPSATKIAFANTTGYNNAVYLMNKMCSTLYSNGLKASARHLNIEDIKNKLYEYTYEDYTYYGEVKYGDIIEYTTKYPAQWLKDSADDKMSDSRTIINKTGATLGPETINIKGTYFGLVNRASNNLDTIYKDGARAKLYDILLIYNGASANDKNYNVWLASRDVKLSSDSAEFGLMYITGAINHFCAWSTKGWRLGCIFKRLSSSCNITSKIY